MKSIRSSFLAGLAVLLPIVITLAVLGFIVNFLTEPFIGVISTLLKKLHLMDHDMLFLSQDTAIKYSSKAVILLLLFLVTTLLGSLARMILIKAAFSIGDKILHKIPIVSSVYKTTQEIINTLFSSDKHTFQKVVLVPFPREGIYALGLISRDSPKICSTTAKADLISVLIPTTPNPTTGFLLMYPREELIHIEMRPEEAIKYIVSCGVIVPHENKIAGQA